MSEINVQVKGGQSAQVPSGATVADALKVIDRDAAKRALAARVNGREVDLTARLDALESYQRPFMEELARLGEENGKQDTIVIEPVLPGTLEGLDVIRHSTAH